MGADRAARAKTIRRCDTAACACARDRYVSAVEQWLQVGTQPHSRHIRNGAKPRRLCSSTAFSRRSTTRSRPSIKGFENIERLPCEQTLGGAGRQCGLSAARRVPGVGHLDARPGGTVIRATAAAVEGLGQGVAEPTRAGSGSAARSRPPPRAHGSADRALLVAGLVLLVDDDETQVAERPKERRAGADYHAGRTAGDHIPLVQTLAGRKARMKHRDRLAKARTEAADGRAVSEISGTSTQAERPVASTPSIAER